MRRFSLFSLGIVALVLTACSGINLSSGVPEVSLALGDVSLATDTTTGESTLSFSVDAYNVQGAPGGVIRVFNLVNGNKLPAGIELDPCPVSAVKACGPFTKNYTFTYPVGSTPTVGSYKIASLVVVGTNGLSRTITYTPPQPIY